MSEEYWRAEFGMVLRYRGPDKDPGVSHVMLVGPHGTLADAADYVVLHDERSDAADPAYYIAPTYYIARFDKDEWERVDV